MNKVLSFQNFRFIFKEIVTKFLESFMSVLPILVVVAVVYGFQFLLLDLNYINKEVISLSLLITFIISGLVLSIGMGIFSLGADMSMTSIGRYVGEDLTKRKSILLMVIVGFLLGTLATIAEPDLTVLAEYIPSEQLNPLVFKVVVGIGINTSKEHFTDDIKDIATSIKKEFNIDVDTQEVIAEICNKIEEQIINNLRRD